MRFALRLAAGLALLSFSAPGIAAAEAPASGPITTAPAERPAGPVVTAPDATAPAAPPSAPPDTQGPASPLPATASVLAPRQTQGVGDCIWAEVPDDVRDAIATAQSIAVVAAAIKSLGADQGSERALGQHCGAPDHGVDPAVVVQQVVEARTMELWTRGQLESAYGVTDARIAGAWADVPALDKTAFAVWFGRDSKTIATETEGIPALVTSLGLSGEDAARLVVYYAGARAAFEALGGTE